MSITVDSRPIYIQANGTERKVVLNTAGGTVSYGSFVGAFTEEGTVTVGSSVTLTQGKWFVSASSSVLQEKAVDEPATDAAALAAHIANVSNPHSVTKTQVGLANAANTTDAGKPISTATQAALDLKANA